MIDAIARGGTQLGDDFNDEQLGREDRRQRTVERPDSRHVERTPGLGHRRQRREGAISDRDEINADVNDRLGREHGVLTGGCKDPNQVRLMPPLTLPDEARELFVETFRTVLGELGVPASSEAAR